MLSREHDMCRAVMFARVTRWGRVRLCQNVWEMKSEGRQTTGKGRQGVKSKGKKRNGERDRSYESREGRRGRLLDPFYEHIQKRSRDRKDEESHIHTTTQTWHI